MGVETEETKLEIKVNGVIDLSISPIQNIFISQSSNKNTNKWSTFIPI